jgi:hypothetical protein
LTDAFSNPAYSLGQAQNLTGEIIPPGGSNAYGPQLPIGWSGGSAASGSGVSDNITGYFTNVPAVATPSNPLSATLSNSGSPSVSTTPTAGAGSPSGTAGSSLSATVNDYFVRAIIIILGMIFVAVGLSMFRGQGQTGLLVSARRAV